MLDTDAVSLVFIARSDARAVVDSFIRSGVYLCVSILVILCV